MLSNPFASIKLQNTRTRRRISIGIYTAALMATFLLLPAVANNYLLHIAIVSMIYIFPSLGLNLIFGYTGLLSLGQGAFFGIGAYTAGLLSIHFGWPFWLIFPSSGMFCAIISLPLALPALRLRAYSFVMCTLGFVFISETVSKNWVSLTRGDMALSGIPRPVLSLWGQGPQVREVVDYYYFTFVLAILGVLLFWWIISSPAGRCMRAIRDEEILAESQGINVFVYKIWVFALSAFYAGLGGAVYVSYTTVVSPLIFKLYHTLLFLVIVFAGGAGTFGGVLVGSFVFVLIPELLRISPDLRMLLYGLFFMFLVLKLPDGLGPLLFRLGNRLLSPQPTKIRAHDKNE
jgi:branched-chain amino acid transport system permease protein